LRAQVAGAETALKNLESKSAEDIWLAELQVLRVALATFLGDKAADSPKMAAASPRKGAGARKPDEKRDAPPASAEAGNRRSSKERAGEAPARPNRRASKERAGEAEAEAVDDGRVGGGRVRER